MEDYLMPSVSSKQQEFFGMVRAMQKGDMPMQGKAGKAARTMSRQDVLDFARTKHKGLPNRKAESLVARIDKALKG